MNTCRPEVALNPSSESCRNAHFDDMNPQLMTAGSNYMQLAVTVIPIKAMTMCNLQSLYLRQHAICSNTEAST